jgi:uncharacterized protein YbjT (DUF2867 family)
MTRILIIGGTGFIGRHLVVALTEAGHPVTASSRREIDLAKHTTAAITAVISGHDLVVNAAGIARDARGQSMQAVHSDGAAKLIAACRAAGVPRLIHISALGAASDSGTGFQRTKGEAEAIFAAARDIACCVLRPSLVIGRGGASTALFAAIAALPLPLRTGPGNWQVQPVHIDDLIALVVRLVAADVSWPDRIDVVGPQPMSTDTLTATLRDWLGLQPAHFLPVPERLMRMAAFLCERLGIGTFNRELLTLLKDGNVASAGSFASALGRAPRPLALALARHPASAADRLEARLTFVRPGLRWSLGLLWVMTGVLSFGLYPRDASYRLLDLVGLYGEPARAALFGGAAVDLMIGVLLLIRWRPVPVGAAMLASMAAFSLIAVRLPAEYWLHPFAPLLKNLPLAAATLAMMAMEA